MITAQMDALKAFMGDNRWHGLEDIAAAINYPVAKVAARLRDLTKKKHGAYTVDKQYTGDGVWYFRLQNMTA